MSLQVEQLLESLRKTGTIDSQGAFTLSLAKARAKLAQFQSSDPARYLVSILSGGVGGGASSIKMVDRGTRVSVWMEGAYLAEEDLLAALNSSYDGEENGALDLVLGCRGALSYEAEKIEIAVSGVGDLGYRWILTQDSETLVKGYLLLGWGALYEVHGEPVKAQDCWMESLDTVRAGTDNRAEELIHCHMDFEPEHILVETGKALALQAVRASS